MFSTSKTATPSCGPGVVQERTTPSPDEIQRQLRCILASPAFHGSKRCQQFLEYVCDKSLSGETGALKERTIAIEVFGRQPQSDLGEDTIVRVGAREVRKRLAQFYVTPEGVASEIRIDLHPGAYSPEFTCVAVHPKEPVAPSVIAVEGRPLRSRVALLLIGASLALAGVGIFAGVRLLGSNPNAELFQRFWDPVMRSQEPLLVAVAHPIVYHASRRAQMLSEENLPPQEVPSQRPVQLQANQMDGSDLVPVLNQYVGFGDMVAVNEVSAMLARKSKGIRLRMASGIEFADLRKTQALLIGAITNRWTMELQQSWRFRFTRNRDFRTVITDTQKPGQVWSIPARDDGLAPEDYILVGRIRNSFTGGLTLVAAGLKQFGTEAAGRLLADPDQLGVILRKLSPGWETKNVQFVLHARVIGNTPAQPEVVASQVW
ncbi:MAG TPA: hypothetical protein VNY05_12800 [Candidatus Acidoferrales bacterium]|nr:hypothetical protein [Candidatus Acidoferrales bacterium]